MEDKLYTVKAFATLTGVTERTLRYYDRIGLLVPTHYNDKGHRLYGTNEIHKIQKILTLKYLGYSLSDIKNYLSRTKEFRFQDTLKQQKELLITKREEIDFVIQTIEKVEKLVSHHDLDSDLLLTIIHSIHHEHAQKEIISKYFSKTFVSQAFLENKQATEREQIEQKFIGYLTQLQELHTKGHHPGDAEVQQIILQIFNSFSEILTPEAQAEIEKIEEFDEDALLLSLFPKTLESFIEDAFEIMKDKEFGGN